MHHFYSFSCLIVNVGMLLGLIFFPLKVKWSLNSTLKKRKFKLISFFLQMLLFFSYIIPCSSWLFLRNEISDLCALHKPFKIFTFLYLIFCGSMMSLRHTVWFMYMTRIFKFDRYPYIYNREGTELHCLKVGILPLLFLFFFWVWAMHVLSSSRMFLHILMPDEHMFVFGTCTIHFGMLNF